MSVENSSSSNPKQNKKRLGLTAILIALLVGYLIVRPRAERYFNITLPHLVENAQDKQGKESVTKNDKANPTNMPVSGQLTKTPGDVYVSTAGLRYKRGSREGHRTKHVMKHSKDQPNRPGSHGVFNGDRAEIFAVIDEAYSIATKRGPPQVRIKKERNRTIYTVHLKRKIGYLGGQTGKRKKNPPLYHIRLVLEGKDVITAFPIKP
ncbi:hypothetical protein MNBD_PLANCTO02-1289 [hydrothermal vent metagenome]|uniref:Uncharacterized protein n=1 Tax=hydrothermal vent metagenome TaxID=652676 RepID=A0A3B1E478_9ZZZZ